MTTDVGVLIVGAGWTGVTAALTLHEHNSAYPDKAVTFAVLEGDPSRLGGRAYSYDYSWTDERAAKRTTAFEHGAQYVGEEQTGSGSSSSARSSNGSSRVTISWMDTPHAFRTSNR
jgi:2-polyprenyl-6-methoxyphenol hydroxylase-like FAD-dependent oxidoreductase